MRETPGANIHHFNYEQDHPRVCGKHALRKFDPLTLEGSPPRMRETPRPSKDFLRVMRITPAYAGNTCSA